MGEQSNVLLSIERSEDEGGLVTVRTTGGWIKNARLAYSEVLMEEERKKEAEYAREMRVIGLHFENLAQENLGLDLAMALGAQVVGPGPFVIDDIKLRIEEHVEGWVLIAGVECGWCKRHNESVIHAQADLGRLIEDPKGECGHCGKDLAQAAGVTGARRSR